MPFFYSFDIYYLIFVVPAFLFALAMQGLVKGSYKKYSAVRNRRGLTGAQAAARVLYYYGIKDVAIERTGGKLTDNYNPKTNVISLSEGVFDSTSVAAIGIACHEAGHAAQHAESYKPILVRNAILPVCNLGSTIGIPLAVIGYFVGFEPLITIGLLLYALVALFQLVTLPVEFNASRRAMAVIDEEAMLAEEEIGGARRVLSAAAMTYVASLAVSIANLLRLFLRMNSNRR